MATTVTKTVKPSGGDYTSLSAWEAAQQGDLTVADEIRQAECYSMLDSTRVDINGWTTDATRYIRVYTPTSERHSGVWDTSKYYLQVGVNFNRVLDIQENNCKIEGLQVRNTLTSGATGLRCTGASGTGTHVSECIVRAEDRPIDIGRDIRCWNTIIYGPNNGGVFVNGQFYSCTIIGGGTYGFNNSGGTTIILKNCYAKGNTAGFNGTRIMTTCASSDASSGSAGLQSIAYSTSQFTNVTSGSEDLSLVSGSALIGVGTDTSGDSAPLDFTDDIIGTARGGTWDVGAFEFIAAAAGIKASPLTLMGVGI